MPNPVRLAAMAAPRLPALAPEGAWGLAAAATAVAAMVLVAVVVARPWLARRGRRRRSALAVERVARVAGSGAPLAAVLDRVLLEVKRERVRGVSIALIGDDRQLYVAAYVGDLDETVKNSRLPVGVGVMGGVAATGRSVLIPDLDQGPVRAANRNLGSNTCMRSMVAVPIRSDGATLGVLEVDSAVPHAFDDDDVAFLELVALAAGGAVRDAGPTRLANELLRRRVRELDRLLTAARTLAGVADPDEVPSVIVSQARQAIGVPAVVLVGLADDRGRPLAVSVEGERLSARVGEPADPGPEVELGTFGAVTEAAVVGMPPPPGLLPAHLERLPSTLVAPVDLQEDGRGLLIAATAQEHGADESVAMLDGIARLAGLALRNAARHRRLIAAAQTDPLTGVLNVLAFERLLNEQHPEGMAVLCIDVDGLKEINDYAGHEAGDEALRRISAALAEATGSRGRIARTGGDAFAVVLEAAADEAAMELAERLRVAVHGVALPFGLARVSIGVGSGAPGSDPRHIWWFAEEALDTARHWGGDRVARAGPGLSTPGSRIRRWDQTLEATLRTHSVHAVYQPVVRLDSRRIVGYEALARPASMRPDQSVEGLFAAAKRSGVSRDLDWLCRRAAFDGARHLPPGLPIYVNCGIWALLDPLHDVDQMLLLCQWAGRSARDVILEITERDLIGDLPRLDEVLTAYRAHGFRFAIDDVGEGHSTLEVLAVASPEVVKVARSLTVGRGRIGARSAVAAVAAFAHTSGAQVVAEGIETEDDAVWMLEHGVDLGQGWLLGKPIELTTAPPRSADIPGLGLVEGATG